MTPAVNALKRAKEPYVLHQYEHDPNCSEYGKEAAEKLGVDPGRVFKTLVAVLDDGRLVVAVIPVLSKLNLKLLAKVFGVKKVTMAKRHQAERATGYIVGGVSPIGQKKKLPTVIDESAQQFDSILVSAGKRGLDLEVAPPVLARMTGAGFANLRK